MKMNVQMNQPERIKQLLSIAVSQLVDGFYQLSQPVPVGQTGPASPSETSQKVSAVSEPQASCAEIPRSFTPEGGTFFAEKPRFYPADGYSVPKSEAYS